MGKFSEAVKNGWLDDVTSGTLYMALFVGDPSSGGVEISGANYARLSVPATSWASASAASCTNTAAVTFPQSNGIQSSDNVTHFALLDAVSGGNIKFQDDLPVAQQQPIVENNTVEFGIGSIVLTISDPV